VGQDISKKLQAEIKTHIDEKKPLLIRGAHSKAFLGNNVNAPFLDVKSHSGIINYHASELVITARAGTTLNEINAALQKHNQYLPFEPPQLNHNSTLGGTIACGLAGSSRPFFGSTRDAVLGCKIVNGHGDILKFGGEVVKNVAGYDASRLMTGAMGTLGLILDVSLKVLPKPLLETTFVREISEDKLHDLLIQLRQSTLPLSGIVYYNNQLYIRVKENDTSEKLSHDLLGKETLSSALSFWKNIQNQTHEFFQTKNRNLWKILLPPASQATELLDGALVDWAGGLYWVYSDKPATDIHQQASQYGGHAVLYRRGEKENQLSEMLKPLPKELLLLQKRLKHAFDPHNIFNPGKLYSDF